MLLPTFFALALAVASPTVWAARGSKTQPSTSVFTPTNYTIVPNSSPRRSTPLDSVADLSFSLSRTLAVFIQDSVGFNATVRILFGRDTQGVLITYKTGLRRFH
jgi:hypothetical protein